MQPNNTIIASARISKSAKKRFKNIIPYLQIAIYSGVFAGCVNSIMYLTCYLEGNVNNIIFSYRNIILNISISISLTVIGYAAYQALRYIIKKLEYKFNYHQELADIAKQARIMSPRQKLHLKNIEIYANAATEINKFIHGITYSNNTLKSIPNLTLEQQHATETIEICSVLVQNITNSMLRLHSIKTETTVFIRTTFNIKMLVDVVFKAVQHFAEKKQIQLHYHTDFVNANMMYGGDFSLLNEVLVNLLIYEIQNTQKGKTIQLLIKKEHENPFNMQIIFALYSTTTSVIDNKRQHNSILPLRNECLLIITNILNVKDLELAKKMNDDFQDIGDLRIHIASKLIDVMNEKTKLLPLHEATGMQCIANHTVRWFRVILKKVNFTMSPMQDPQERDHSEPHSLPSSRSSSNASILSRTNKNAVYPDTHHNPDPEIEEYHCIETKSGTENISAVNSACLPLFTHSSSIHADNHLLINDQEASSSSNTVPIVGYIPAPRLINS